MRVLCFRDMKNGEDIAKKKVHGKKKRDEKRKTASV